MSKEEALLYHRAPVSGKYETVPCKPLNNQHDLSLAYTPYVAHVCQSIVENPQSAYSLTMKGRLVAVITNGTSVLGLGDIGPLAAKPVMEGKAVLFQKFGRINAFDIEIDEKDPVKLVEIIKSLEPTFGGINLEDIKAPECFFIEEELKKTMGIPVFHDDQHGTAMTVAAALLNALHLVEKKIEDIRIVVSGAGAGALASLNLLCSMGLEPHQVWLCDSQGLIHKGRENLSTVKSLYAQETDLRTLEEAFKGADVFLGLSRAGVVSPAMIQSMASNPIIFALANPTPEIMPQEVYQVRCDAIVGTGRSDFPNQINNLICFPYIFRGAIDAQSRVINAPMMHAMVKALCRITREGFSDVLGHYKNENKEFGRDYIIPKPFDPRLLAELPLVVAQAAIESGAGVPFDLEAYAQTLIAQAYEDYPLFRDVLLGKKTPKSLTFTDLELEQPIVRSLMRALKRYALIDTKNTTEQGENTLFSELNADPVFFQNALNTVLSWLSKGA